MRHLRVLIWSRRPQTVQRGPRIHVRAGRASALDTPRAATARIVGSRSAARHERGRPRGGPQPAEAYRAASAPQVGASAKANELRQRRAGGRPPRFEQTRRHDGRPEGERRASRSR